MVSMRLVTYLRAKMKVNGKIAGPAPAAKRNVCDIGSGTKAGSVKAYKKPTEAVGGSIKEICTDEESKITKVGTNPDLSAGKIKRF